MTVVHSKSHFCKTCSAVILGNSTPSVTERIDTVEVFFVHSHILADLSDAIVNIGSETVRVTVSLVEGEKELIIFRSKILFKDWLNEGLYTHLHISLV